MADRGRLFYDANGKLRQVDPAADISGEPAEADLEPVEFVQIDVEEVGGKGIKTSTQDVATGTLTTVTLDSAASPGFEDADVVTVDTTDNQLTINVAGVYLIVGLLNWSEQLSDTSQLETRLVVNGATVARDRIKLGGGVPASITVSTVEVLSVNDNLTLQTFHNHGAARQLSGDRLNSLAAVKLS